MSSNNDTICHDLDLFQLKIQISSSSITALVWLLILLITITKAKNLIFIIFLASLLLVSSISNIIEQYLLFKDEYSD